MSFDFSRIAELSTARGKLVELKNSAGRVIWAVKSAGDGKVILEVEKITSDTYAGETTYTGEEFILLDIYPETNGTVKVTYGGLTKTITDTSGAAEPNAQQVFFGTFNGVTDEVATPSSGTLTIEGDYRGFSVGTYAKSSKSFNNCCGCITAVTDWGSVKRIYFAAFRSCTALTSITIPDSVTNIGGYAFSDCTALTSVTIPDSVTSAGDYVFYNCAALTSITVASGNETYYSSGNCLIETATQTLLYGCMTSVIPDSVKAINYYAFYGSVGLTSITIPDSVTNIGGHAFSGCTGLTSATFDNTSGWYVTTTSGATSGTDVNVTDAASNVTMLTDTYKNYYWYRAA